MSKFLKKKKQKRKIFSQNNTKKKKSKTKPKAEAKDSRVKFTPKAKEEGGNEWIAFSQILIMN